LSASFSTGQASPPGFRYDQQQGVWVFVLEGEACAVPQAYFEPDAAIASAKPGQIASAKPGQRPLL
jgi:hypothetical protein